MPAGQVKELWDELVKKREEENNAVKKSMGKKNVSL